MQFAYSLWEINVARWQLVWQRRGCVPVHFIRDQIFCRQTARLSMYKRLWRCVFSHVSTWRPLHVVISLATACIALSLAVNWHVPPSCDTSLQQFVGPRGITLCSLIVVILLPLWVSMHNFVCSKETKICATITRMPPLSLIAYSRNNRSVTNSSSYSHKYMHLRYSLFYIEYKMAIPRRKQ